MLHIDGSYREGGGQIIRTAIALSALTRIPFRAEKIRQNRPRSGLKSQHLCCINALEKLSDARVKGAQLGSDIPVILITGRAKADTQSNAVKYVAIYFLLKPFAEQAFIEIIELQTKGTESKS
nr:RNA 3'-terminal phosphate cyclase [uncultured Desulfobacter sp.]